MKKTIFLDIDGTIIYDRGYIDSINEIEFPSSTFDALEQLSINNYELIIITNQSGIGRGYFTKEIVITVNQEIVNQCTNHNISFKKILFCPHKPISNCECRKPKIGLINKYLPDYDFNPKESWMIGDKESDIGFGLNLGLSTILISNNDKHLKFSKYKPHFRVKNLKEATIKILSNEKH